MSASKRGPALRRRIAGGTRVVEKIGGETGRVLSWVRWDRDYFKIELDSGRVVTRERVQIVREDEARTCRHCERSILPDRNGWIDPRATGDDRVWRETCDGHDTFTANHEPKETEDA